MALRKIKLGYYAYFRDERGKQRTVSLHTRDERIAKKLHRELMEAVARAKTALSLSIHFGNTIPFAAPAPAQTPPLTAEAAASAATSIPDTLPANKRLRLDRMLEVAAERRNIAPRHAAAFNRFIEAVSPKQYADEITPKIAMDYLDKAFPGAKTYNNNITMLNVIFKACLIRAGMDASPFATVPRRIVRGAEHFRPLTADEFRAIFAVAAEPWKTAALISWHTALRLETCFRLSWHDIDEADQSITILPGKTARFGRAVYVPIHPELWQHLNSLTRPTDPLQPILSQWQKYIHFHGHKNQTYFAGMLDELNIKSTSEGKAGFHSLRVSFITRCDEAGITRSATRGIAGHTTDDMTDLYSHDRATAKQILTLPNVLTPNV